MNRLTILTQGIVLPREALEELRESLVQAWSNGKVSIGRVRSLPKMLYMFWHGEEDRHVSMVVRECALSTASQAREIAMHFVERVAASELLGSTGNVTTRGD